MPPYLLHPSKKPWADTVTFSLPPPLQTCSFYVTPLPFLKDKRDLFQKAVFKSFYTHLFDLNLIYNFLELKAKVTEVTFAHIIVNENGHNFPKLWPFFFLTDLSAFCCCFWIVWQNVFKANLIYTLNYNLWNAFERALECIAWSF